MTDKAWTRFGGVVVFIVGLRETLNPHPTYKHIPIEPWIPFIIMFIGAMIIAMTFIKKDGDK